VYHPRFVSGIDNCPNPGFALAVAFAIYANPQLRERALRRFELPEGHNWNTPVDFARWFATQDAEYVWRSSALLLFFAHDQLDI
jgi:hypothetical protein